MTSARFFSLTLLLPVLIGVAAIAFNPSSILVSALVYGGLPYFVLAAIAYIPIRRAKSLARLAAISLTLPLALAVSLAAVGGGLLAMYALIVGFAYVALAWLLYGVARSVGVVAALKVGRNN